MWESFLRKQQKKPPLEREDWERHKMQNNVLNRTEMYYYLHT